MSGRFVCVNFNQIFFEAMIRFITTAQKEAATRSHAPAMALARAPSLVSPQEENKLGNN